MIFRIFQVVFFGLVVVLVSACSTPVGIIDSSSNVAAVDKLVMQRAQQRWDAILAGELNQAYALISPSGRAKLQAQDYRLRVNTSHFRKAKVQEASCQVDSCDVKISLDYVIGGLSLNQTLSEIWILDEGNWWFVYRG